MNSSVEKMSVGEAVDVVRGELRRGVAPFTPAGIEESRQQHFSVTSSPAPSSPKARTRIGIAVEEFYAGSKKSE